MSVFAALLISPCIGTLNVAHLAARVSLFAPAVEVVALAERLAAARPDDGASRLPAQGAAARVPLAAHVAAHDVARVPRAVQGACNQAR